MKLSCLFLILLIASCNVDVGKEYYKSGTLETTGKLVDGKKSGVWKYYYESGEYQGGGNYLHGKRNGLWKWFHDNGELRQIGDYLNDKQVGEWKFYHENKNMAGIGTSLQNGEKNGRWVWFHSNNQLYTERLWSNGKLVEILSCFDGKGKKLEKGTLKNGTGTMNLYDINGSLEGSFEYVNGVYQE